MSVNYKTRSFPFTLNWNMNLSLKLQPEQNFSER